MVDVDGDEAVFISLFFASGLQMSCSSSSTSSRPMRPWFLAHPGRHQGAITFSPHPGLHRRHGPFDQSHGGEPSPHARSLRINTRSRSPPDGHIFRRRRQTGASGVDAWRTCWSGVVNLRRPDGRIRAQRREAQASEAGSSRIVHNRQAVAEYRSPHSLLSGCISHSNSTPSEESSTPYYVAVARLLTR
jgi:hypothetical protein